MNKAFDDIYQHMPWDKIDNVVFDVGNVLIVPGFDGIYEVYRLSPEMQSFLYKKMFLSPYWSMMDLGIVTLEEAIDAMVGKMEEIRPHVDFIARHWMEYKKPLKEGVDVLKKCKEQRKKLFVLSNYPKYAFEALTKMFDFFSLFDGQVISSKVQMVKPEKEIYIYLIDKYRLIPSRTLLIDDSAQNVETALRCGLQGICANISGKLTDFFQ